VAPPRATTVEVPLQIGDQQLRVVVESLCHDDGVVGLFRARGLDGGDLVGGRAGRGVTECQFELALAAPGVS